MIIDSQVHAYEADSPQRPWVDDLPGPREVTGQQLIASMDEVGVDAAILVSPWTMYRYDYSYAVEVQQAFPDRIALVAPVNIDDPGVAEFVAEWAGVDGAVGIRIFKFPQDPADRGFNEAIKAAQRHGLVVNLLTFEHHDQVLATARAHPDCQFALDHLGMRPPKYPPLHPEPFKLLLRVLEFSELPNIAMKLTGSGTMSDLPYPFDDIWDPILRLIDGFGPERCMWGSDWTRAVEFLTYREAVDSFRLNERFSQNDLNALMGGSLKNIYGWKPSGR